jgi:hypothetical protein
MKNIIIKYGTILFAGLLIESLILHSSFFNSLGRRTISQIVELILPFIVLIFAQKRILKLNSEITIFKLTMAGLLIQIISELLLQICRQCIFTQTDWYMRIDIIYRWLYYLVLSILWTIISGTVFSFLVAFQLKTKKTGQLILFILGLTIIVIIIRILRQI